MCLWRIARLPAAPLARVRFCQTAGTGLGPRLRPRGGKPHRDGRIQCASQGMPGHVYGNAGAAGSQPIGARARGRTHRSPHGRGAHLQLWPRASVWRRAITNTDVLLRVRRQEPSRGAVRAARGNASLSATLWLERGLPSTGPKSDGLFGTVGLLFAYLRRSDAPSASSSCVCAAQPHAHKQTLLQPTYLAVTCLTRTIFVRFCCVRTEVEAARFRERRAAAGKMRLNKSPT